MRWRFDGGGEAGGGSDESPDADLWRLVGTARQHSDQCILHQTHRYSCLTFHLRVGAGVVIRASDTSLGGPRSIQLGQVLQHTDADSSSRTREEHKTDTHLGSLVDEEIYSLLTFNSQDLAATRFTFSDVQGAHGASRLLAAIATLGQFAARFGDGRVVFVVVRSRVPSRSRRRCGRSKL